MRFAILAPIALVMLVTACSSSSPAAGFSVSSANLDASYACPKGATNSPYTIHGTVQLHNPTTRTVTIEAVRADMTLAAVKGAWLEKLGDVYRVDSASFGPGIVNPGSTLTMNVGIPSACTNGKTSTAVSYGDYSVLLRVVTTEGTYSVGASHDHRITT